MKVFNVCMQIIKRRSSAILLYFVIFLALSVVIPSLSYEELATDFSKTRMNFTIINRDESTPLTDGLTAYLSEYGNNIILDDDKQTLQDAAFYHATDFIAIIPHGFNAAFLSGTPAEIQTVVTTQGAKGYYVDMLVNQYLNQVRIMNAAAESEQEAVNAALDILGIESKVEVKRFGGGAPVNTVFVTYTRMLSYIVLVLVFMCITLIMKPFRRADIKMRNLCAPLKPRSISAQQILCGVLVSLAVWLLFTMLGAVLYSGDLSGVDSRIIRLLCLNLFIMTMLALALASVASPFIKNMNSLNSVANIMSLALSFLGGVFVPLELLGEGMLSVSRFTPLYWYVTATEHITSLTSFTSETLAPVRQAFLIQGLYAVTLFCVALVIGKYKNQSEAAYGNTKTEFE